MFAFLNALLFRIRARFSQDALNAELTEEMRMHEELLREELEREGATADQAKREAAYRFGNALNARETARDAWSFGWIDALVQDTKYAARFLRKSPAFTVVAVLSLALGIGANATVFSVADRLLFSASPHVENPDALFLLNVKRVIKPTDERPFYPSVRFPEYFALREASKTIASMTVFTPAARVRLGNGPDAERIKETMVAWNYFDLLGTRPAHGRFFVHDDTVLTESLRAAVISDSYWKRHYGKADSALGSRFTTSGLDFVVVGIAPAGFTGVELEATDVWVPLETTASVRIAKDWKTWTGNSPQVVARFHDGVTAEQASLEATMLFNRIPEIPMFGNTQETVRFGSIIQSRGPADQGGAVKVSTRLVLAALLVLIAACANLANLLLVRAVTRRREIALRLAIGISRRRLVLQMLIESMLIALLGVATALVATVWGGKALRALVFPEMQWATAPVDPRVFIAAVACGTIVAAIATLVPAIRMTRADVGNALKAGASNLTVSAGRFRQSLLVVQVALSLLLIVGAGAFSRSLSNAYRFDMGLDVDQLVTVRMFLESESIPAGERTVMFEDAARRLERVAGVEHVSISNEIPLTGNSMTSVFHPENPTEGVPATFWTATPDLMRHAGFRLLKGRLPNSDDVAPGMPSPVVISDAGARRLWPGGDAIGKCVRFSRDTAPCSEVVGVISDLRRRSLHDEAGVTFMVGRAQPELKDPLSAYLVVRTSANIDAEKIKPSLHAALRNLRPDLRTLEIRTLAQSLDADYRPLKLGAATFGSFAALALLLAAIGLYGILAFNVTQRTSEFGIRSALGAARGHIVRFVVRESIAIVLAGVATGAALSWYASNSISALLFETSARDARFYLLGAAALVLIALVAAAIPALRAARVDPSIALRAE